MNKKLHHLPFTLSFHSTASMVQLQLTSNLTHFHSLFSGDCLDRSCSHHGTCSEGVCYCDLGWMGETCGYENTMIKACLPDCSGHGSYDVSAGHCRYPLSLFISEITIYFIWVAHFMVYLGYWKTFIWTLFISLCSCAYQLRRIYVLKVFAKTQWLEYFITLKPME